MLQFFGSWGEALSDIGAQFPLCFPRAASQQAVCQLIDMELCVLFVCFGS